MAFLGTEDDAEFKRHLKDRSRGMWKSFDFMSRRLRYVGKRGLTTRGLLEAAIYRLSKNEREALRNPNIYYYESREGPYDWLVDEALMKSIIQRHPEDSGRFVLGSRAVPPKRRKGLRPKPTTQVVRQWTDPYDIGRGTPGP